MSKLGWIDFSSDEREKVKQVLAALNEKGTLDELGIGQIRDALANRLFPGISTIQTRAKYFVTIARLMRDIQHGKANKSRSPQLWLEQQEHLLAKQFVSTSRDGKDKVENGVIGAESINSGGVSRRPSSVYWNGLKTFGLVNTKLSLNEFCSYLAKNTHVSHAANQEHQEGADDEDVDRLERLIDLPEKNIDDWQYEQALSIYLDTSEATFLRDKLMLTPLVEHSVPAQILRVGGLSALLGKLDESDYQEVELKRLSFDAMVEVLLSHDRVSEKCKLCLKQAQAFSLAIEGAHICYNLALVKNVSDKRVSELEQKFNDWRNKIDRLGVFYTGCVDDWFAVIAGSRINDKARKFVDSWARLISNDASIEQLVALVEERARQNKKGRCLLNKNRYTDDLASMRRLNYRWPVAWQLLLDIQNGLDAN